MEAKATDKDTTLHYIDKLFGMAEVTKARGFRVTIIQLTTSLPLLALSGGLATTQGTFAFGGVGLKVPVAVFLAGGALLVSSLVYVVQVYNLSVQVAQSEIHRLYKSIGFKDPTLDYGMFFGMLRSRLVTMLGGGIIGTTFPTSAQVAAGFKVSELLRFEGLGWIWLVFVLLAVSTKWVSDSMAVSRLPQIVRAYGQQIDESRIRRPVRIFGLVLALLGVAFGYFVAKVLGSS